MILKTFVEGPIDANNYLLIDEESKEAVMIDCSDARKELLEEIKSLGIKLKYILLTHGHFDHIMGVDVFKEQFGVDAYVSQDDIEQVKITPNMIFMFTGLHPAFHPVLFSSLLLLFPFFQAPSASFHICLSAHSRSPPHTDCVHSHM